MRPVRQNESIVNLLEHLTELLFRTWSAFLVAKNLDKIVDSSEYVSSRYFISSAYGACIESALLGFSKLMSNKKNEICMLSILDIVDTEVTVSEGTYPQDFHRLSQIHREQLVKMKPLVDNIKIWRNKAIAHTDKIFMIKTSDIAQAEPVVMEDLSLSLIQLQEMINLYRNMFGLGGIRLEDAEIKMATEWIYLAELLKKNS